MFSPVPAEFSQSHANKHTHTQTAVSSSLPEFHFDTALICLQQLSAERTQRELRHENLFLFSSAGIFPSSPSLFSRIFLESLSFFLPRQEHFRLRLRRSRIIHVLNIIETKNFHFERGTDRGARRDTKLLKDDCRDDAFEYHQEMRN